MELNIRERVPGMDPGKRWLSIRNLASAFIWFLIAFWGTVLIVIAFVSALVVILGGGSIDTSESPNEEGVSGVGTAETQLTTELTVSQKSTSDSTPTITLTPIASPIPTPVPSPTLSPEPTPTQTPEAMTVHDFADAVAARGVYVADVKKKGGGFLSKPDVEVSVMLGQYDDQYQDAVREIVIEEFANAIAKGMGVDRLKLFVFSDRDEDTDWNFMQKEDAEKYNAGEITWGQYKSRLAGYDW